MNTTSVWTPRTSGTWRARGGYNYVAVEPGARFLEWSRRYSSTLNGYIVTVAEARHDPYFGEYISAGMVMFDVFENSLELVERGQTVIS